MSSARPRARLRALIVASAISTGLVVGVAPSALASGTTPQATGTHASSQTHSTTRHQSRQTWSQRFSAKADRVLRVTRAQRGDPYQYGAAGPSRFDCSGLVMYVFRRALGRSLPHNAEMQMHHATHIKRRNARPGDLVFKVDRSGYAYHVGIFAGHGWFWNAPHTGSHVKPERLWGGGWRFGRIIRA